jgi:hypothetical protein
MALKAAPFCLPFYSRLFPAAVCQQPLKQVLLVKVITSSILMRTVTNQLVRRNYNTLVRCRGCQFVEFILFVSV